MGIQPGSAATAPQVDAGLQAGLGFRVKDVLLRANYLPGLRSGETLYTTGYTYSNYNRSFQASASYLFSL